MFVQMLLCQMFLEDNILKNEEVVYQLKLA